MKNAGIFYLIEKEDNAPDKGVRIKSFLLNNMIKDNTLEGELEKLEMTVEGHLLNIFEIIGTRATMKTDRKSLPFKNEIVVKQGGTSFLNDVFEYDSFIRKVLKELLDKNIYKFRFYVNIQVSMPKMKLLSNQFTYSFRYYPYIEKPNNGKKENIQPIS